MRENYIKMELNISLFFSLNFFESVKPSGIKFSLNTTQALTTGPIKGPLPTSSTPAIYLIPFLYNSLSY